MVEFDSLVNSRTASMGDGPRVSQVHHCALMPDSAWAFTTGGGFHLL